MGNKRIVYDYFFVYDGKGEYEGRPVAGATVSLCIRPYTEDGKEVLLKDGEEPSVSGRYLSDVFSVAFDPEYCVKVEKRLFVAEMFRVQYGWTRIEFDTLGYSLDVAAGRVGDMQGMGNLSSDIADMSVSEGSDVPADKFRAFLMEHKDGFDTSNNVRAQVLSVGFVDA